MFFNLSVGPEFDRFFEISYFEVFRADSFGNLFYSDTEEILYPRIENNAFLRKILEKQKFRGKIIFRNNRT